MFGCQCVVFLILCICVHNKLLNYFNYHIWMFRYYSNLICTFVISSNPTGMFLHYSNFTGMFADYNNHSCMFWYYSIVSCRFYFSNLSCIFYQPQQMYIYIVQRNILQLNSLNTNAEAFLVVICIALRQICCGSGLRQNKTALLLITLDQLEELNYRKNQ